MTGQEEDSTRRYATRPSQERRPPPGLNGFVTEDAALQSTDSQSPATAQPARPRPRPYDRANHPDSSDDEDLISPFSSSQKLTNNARQASSTDATDPAKKSSNGSSRGLGGTIGSRPGGSSLVSSLRRISQPKGVPSKGSLATPKITSVFSPAASILSSPSSTMGPPPPPSSQRLRYSTSSIAIQGSDADISQPGTTAEVPIDVTDAEESQSSASSTSTHKRKDNSPAAALEAASIAWKRAQKTAADQKAAAEEGVEWQPGPGKTASTVYLNYGPPTLSKYKAGKAVIAFPCLCCTPSVEVVRHCSESSTSNLRTHIFRQQNKRSQTTIPAMLASQRPIAASDTISLLPFSVTRQMSVAWVAESGRPLSIIEDKISLPSSPRPSRN
ncbi:unnamed protein product [Tilletia caries]|uniref:Uncharacterized protein n=1 Tax=Tilletia caries TaxID=13290 RepID=A0ABN7J5R1_9BASI|nr:unnamed protein product [Tilletia caries]CAD6947784.1 unnamed protein product [Tilletia caries]